MIVNMKKTVLLSLVAASILTTGCANTAPLPQTISIKNVAQNPEGIEYDKTDNTFLLSSINAQPIIKVQADGNFTPFTSGEAFPLSTAGLQVDYKHNRLLVAGFNGMELMDNKPETKGAAFLRIYDLKTGKLQKDINLSHVVPEAQAYFANDIAVDKQGNAYVSDWYAKVIYKVDMQGKVSVFWKNDLSTVKSGVNGLDVHPDGYVIASLLSVNKKGLYEDFALVKIPVNDASKAQYVSLENQGFAGFDGMVLKDNGSIVGVTNNQKTPGGNTLIELSSSTNWKSAKVIQTKTIPASTTVAVTPDNKNYVIQQNFMDNFKKEWNINHVEF